MKPLEPIAPLLSVLRDLIKWFEDMNVRGLVIGGVAASLLGRPRITHDVDALVLLKREEWNKFLTEGKKLGFVLRVSDAIAFAQKNRVFLACHEPSGIDVDISIGTLPYGPVTVTHPDITRYFMTISEACKLILQAGAMGEGEEIFILDMGTPIKIVDMARDLIRRSGFKPDVDIEIKFIGLRPAEKLHEELVTEGEGILPSPHERIFVLKGGNNNNLDHLNQKIEELVKLALEQDTLGIKSKLKEIVPEYQPFDLNNCTPLNH